MVGPIELASQELQPIAQAASLEPTFHMPLLDLESVAPSLDNVLYNPSGVRFSFSNDSCTAPYFSELSVRTQTAEYQAAKNRVALVVGESGLAANLHAIPEETIIILDSSLDMCVFMQGYVNSLRSSPNRHAWLEQLANIGPSNIPSAARQQVSTWKDAGFSHPLVNDGAFAQAQKSARDKAIVVWNGDITNTAEMHRLGQALREQEATITMMNLTNVLPYVARLNGHSNCDEQLATLPVSPEAPILTTGISKRTPRTIIEHYENRQGGGYNEVTGPFFGLTNLVRARQSGPRSGLGAIEERQYADGANSTDDLNDYFADRVLDAMHDGHLDPSRIPELTDLISQLEGLLMGDVPPGTEMEHPLYRQVFIVRDED